MTRFKSVDVKINIGTARDVATFAAYALTKGVIANDDEERALRRFANAIAGPVSGNLLGNVLDLRDDKAALQSVTPFVDGFRKAAKK